MTLFLRKMRSVATIGLAAIVASVGASLLLRAAMESRVSLPASPRLAAVAQEAAKPSRPLAGVVSDEAGRPIAGATVVAGQFGGGEPNHRLVTTGPDGRFEVTPAGKSARLEYVLVYKERLAPASLLLISRDDRSGEGEVVLQLSQPVPFVGVVKDREGKPVAGATARLEYAEYPGFDGPKTRLNVIEPIVLGTPLEGLFRSTTDAQGRFRFPALAREAKVSLVVTAAGMGEYSTMNRLRPERTAPDRPPAYLVGTADAPAQVVLAPAARVVGRIVSRFSSVKVAGLKVAMQGVHGSDGIWREAQSDAVGRFEFIGLDEGKANIFLMDHPNDGPWTYRAAADTELRPGRTTEVEIELIRGVAVEGKVVDGGTGEPLAGVGVGLYGPMRPRSGAAIVSETTDKEGRYRFRLPPGETRFYVCGPVPAGYGRAPVGGHNIVIPADARVFTVPKIEIRKAEPAR